MPNSAHDLVELLNLEVIEDNLFRGRQPDTERQRVFGGQVAAQALTAAIRTVDPERHVHSLHSYFLRPGDTAVPIVYDVERLRDGGSFSTRRVVARQHGRAIFILAANFQVLEPGFDHQDPMPETIAPEQARDYASLIRERTTSRDAEEFVKEWSALEMRLAGTSVQGLPADPTHPAQSRFWIRTSGRLPDDPGIQMAAFTYASDLTLLAVSLMPHDITIASPRLQPASLDHTIWFHRPFRADEWWLYDQWSPSAQGARGLAMARVYTPDGTLVASVAQEGLIRPVEPR